MGQQKLKERRTIRRSAEIENNEGGGVSKHSNSSISMPSYSNVYRRLVAATRRLQELLTGLLNIS